MNIKANPEKFRKLPIVALVTGILSLTVFSFQALQMWFSNYLITDTARLIFNFCVLIILGIVLPVVAIVCGSIDLARISKGILRRKLFKGFDLTGIVIGSPIFLLVSFEVIVPH